VGIGNKEHIKEGNNIAAHVTWKLSSLVVKIDEHLTQTEECHAPSDSGTEFRKQTLGNS
jgi:hypothetical protein